MGRGQWWPTPNSWERGSRGREEGKLEDEEADSLVVRLESPHVRGAVYQERGVEREHVPELGGHQVSGEQVLAPQPPGHERGQHVRQEGGQRRVQAVLPHHHPVGLHVGHVHGGHLRLERRVRAHQRPADVRVEEPAVRVVRVRVRVRVLVVQPVVAHPVVDAVLHADRLEQRHEHAERQLGLVSVVRPQPVRAGRHADGRQRAHHERCVYRQKTTS